MNSFSRVVAGVLLGVALCAQTASAEQLIVVHSGSWPPYASADLPGQGLAIELVSTAFKRAGYTPRVKTATLAEILEGSKTGAYDVFATPWYTMERNQYLAFSQPYLQSSIHFIKRTDTPFEYARFDELENMKIGVIEGYAYDEDFNDSAAIEKIPAGSLEENLRKLVDKQIDLSLDDELVLRYTVERALPERAATLQVVPEPLSTRGVNIGVSRANPAHEKIVAAFDKAIAEMKQDGTHEAIVHKHRDYIGHPDTPQDAAR
jgi:polar amino acid transport system substrate-binding protein